MADIFVSYSRHDRKRVAPLVELLTGQGWSVWWDREINPGERFEELIDREITAARVVLVVWSRHSIPSRWVRNEALEAMDRDILVPVCLDRGKVPVAFRQSQAADLTKWPSAVDEVEIEHLLSAIGEKLRSPYSLGNLGDYLSFGKRRTGFRRPAVFGAALAAVAGLALVLWWLTASRPQTAELASSMAIMRLQPATGSATEAFLADSLGEELSALLAGVEGLQVSNRLAAWEMPAGLARGDIADRLKVNYLLEGEVVQQEAGLQATLSLLRVPDEAVVFSGTYGSVGTDIQSLRNEIALAVLQALGLDVARLSSVFAEQLRVTSNSAAFELYLRAKDLLRRSGEAPDLERARDLLIQASQQDPSFGLAYAAMCRANLGLYKVSGDTGSFQEAERACHRAMTLNERSAEVYLAVGQLYEFSGQHDRARSEYERALLIDPFLAEALVGIGSVRLSEGELEGAENAFRRGVDVQPGYWRAHNDLGRFLLETGRPYEAIEAFARVTYLAPNNSWGFSNLGAARFGVGDFEGAIREWRHALEIDSESGALSNMGTAYFFLRDYQAAADMYREAIAQAPSDFRLWLNLGDALRFVDMPAPGATTPAGAVTDARAAYQRAIDLAAREQVINPSEALAVSAQAMAFAFLGQLERAESLMAKALEIEDSDPEVLYDLALTSISLGRPEQALEGMSRAVALGYAKILLDHDPMFDPLRGDPRFQQLASAVGG